MPAPYVTTTRQGPVAVITVDCPATRNRLDAALRSQIADACLASADDEEVRVLLIEGTGDAFAAGIEPAPASLTPEGAASVVASVRKPTIAWIAGECVDAGLELALACDVRVASAGASFSMRHVQQGGLPSDGGTQRLARQVGRGHALRLLLTGEVINAQEAERIGLVERTGGRHDALALALEIAKGAPLAAAYAKEAVATGLDLTLEHGLRLEADLGIMLHSTADRAEGLRSFAERRQPGFKGR